MARTRIHTAIKFIFAFFLLFCTGRDGCAAAGQKQIIVVLRCDDYSSRSSPEIETRLIDALKRYNVPCTFGVIPYVCARDFEDMSEQACMPLSSVKAGILKRGITEGVLDVALHGYSHQTCLDEKQGGYAEFSGQSYDKQLKKIRDGKDLLESMLDIQVDIFIPPWNRYGPDTLKALEGLGFRCISAGPYGDAEQASGLKFLPATCTLPELREAVGSAGRIPDDQPVIVAYFHANSFLDINKRGGLWFSEFEGLLDWLGSRKDINVLSAAEAVDMVADLSARRLIHYRSFLRSFYLLPSFLRPSSRLVYFHSEDAYRSHIIYWRGVTLFFYAGILLCSFCPAFFAGLLIFPRLRSAEKIFKYCGAGILVLFSIYAFHDLVINYKGAIGVTALLGGCIGVWTASWRLKKP
ncbi:MAG: DUF2334 domain-containing protein [Candidatus Omnitrophica bacterium]|nr:DUF2334 domain-containing protein [Candidatus Omnitrophota bacterium]